MRKTICASILVLALCGSALAGDMGCPPAPGDISSPPSAPQTYDGQNPDSSTGTGLSATVDDITTGDKADGLTTTALNFISSVLTLL